MFVLHKWSKVGMLRNMVGGRGIRDAVEVTAMPTTKVEMSKMCSDSARAVDATRKRGCA